MFRSLDVTPPPDVATVQAPARALPPGLLPSATVTLPVNVGTRLPAGSSALSWTAGLIAPPATVLVGCWVNASRVAVPGVMSNGVLVTGAKPPALAAKIGRAAGRERVWFPELATPLTAATVVVPLSVLPPGLLPSATVTRPVKLGTGFPAGSSAVTCTAGLIAAPATVFDGCTVKASWVAVPGMMSNGVLVTGAKPPALAASV